MRSFNGEDQTWDSVCQCIEQIFAHKFDVARSLLCGYDVTSVEVSQRIMWISLRTIVVQETFLAKGIENHKCLAGAYYKFLMRNSQSSQVSVMRKTVDRMAASNEALIKKVDVTEAKVCGAEGAADKAAKAVKELERKFDKRDGRGKIKLEQGLQVELEVLNYINSASTATFVLAESWLACSFVAKALGHENIHTYLKGLSLKSKGVLKKTEIGPTLALIPGPSILWKFETSTLEDDCWIQGSALCVEKMATQWVTSKGLATVYIILSDVTKNGRIQSDLFPSHTSKLKDY